MTILYEKIIDGERWVALSLEELPSLVGKNVKIYEHMHDRECETWGVITAYQGRYEVHNFPNQYFRLNQWDEWWVTQSDDDPGFIMFVKETDLIPFTDNKGKAKCGQCGCKTEMRRDFSDMSIREFCPRCKR